MGVRKIKKVRVSVVLEFEDGGILEMPGTKYRFPREKNDG